MLLITVPFADRIGFDKGWILGYTGIVLSFTLVYFGIRAYRDTVKGGTIGFGAAFAVGSAIMLISCLCYVVVWEFVYYNFMPDFMDKYAAYMLAKAHAAGATPAAIDAQVRQLEQYRAMYANPWTNAALTFIEPFPVGVLAVLISAGILRKKTRTPGLETSLG